MQTSPTLTVLTSTKENPFLSNPFLTISQPSRSPVANETHGAGPSGDAQHLNKGCVRAVLQFPDEATSAAQPELCNLPHFALGDSCFFPPLLIFHRKVIFLFIYLFATFDYGEAKQISEYFR